MADNLTVSPSATFDVATDEIGGFQYQKMKLFDATADSTTPVVYDANRGFLVNAGQVQRIAVTPTISASAVYAVGDAVGGLLTFANAARFSGGGLRLKQVTLIDKTPQLAPASLVLFDRTFTATADNAAFNPSDADMANVLTVVPLGNYVAFPANAVAVAPDLDLPILLNGTSLFGQLFTWSTPVYGTTADLTVVLSIIRE